MSNPDNDFFINTADGGMVEPTTDELLNINNVIPPTQVFSQHPAITEIDDEFPVAAAAASAPASNNVNNAGDNDGNGGGNGSTEFNQLAPYQNNTLALANKSKISSSQSNTKKSKASKSKPAFVMKIWTMVNDVNNKNLIDWFPDGKSFIVTNRESFVQKILPKYFKHSNFASFVRQLNMYGWHKVQDANSGSLHSDEKWQFENKNFIKGKPELLDKIVRNKPNEEAPGNETNGTSGAQFDVNLLISELNNLKNNQRKITQELSRVRSDNELLWQELFSSREKNILQNDKIEKILQFLASVYGNKLPTIENNLGLNNHGTTSYYHQPIYNQAYQSPNQSNQSNQQQQPYSNMNPNGANNTVATSQGGMPVDLNGTPSFQKPRLMISQTRHVSNPNSNSNTPLSNGSGSTDTPIQELSRTPGYTPGGFTPNFPQQPQTPVQQSAYSPYNHYLPSDDFQGQRPTLQDSQGVQGAHFSQQVQQQGPHHVQQSNNNNNNGNNNNQATHGRPNVSTHQPSFEDLSKTIEAQGQSIDDIIDRIQAGKHYNADNEREDKNNTNDNSTNTTEYNQYDTPNTGSTPSLQPFDLDEFLNQDLLPQEEDDYSHENHNTYNGYNNMAKEPKLGTVREIVDDDGKRLPSAKEEELEKLNPAKKRKSARTR